MDSMTEMFYEESNGILRDMRRNLMESQEKSSYEQELVLDLFRGVHTLKADSAMMLYENISTLSKKLESLLYCFRGEKKAIRDTARFVQIISDYLGFIEKETDKIAAGRMPDGDIHELENRIGEYTSEVVAMMEKKEVDEYHSMIAKPKRQVYYISSAPDEDTKSEADEKVLEAAAALTAGEETSKNTKENINGKSTSVEKKKETLLSDSTKEDIVSANKGMNKKRYMISDVEKEKIHTSSSGLLRLIDEIEYSIGDKNTGSITRDQLVKLQKIQQNILWVKNKLTNTNFVPVAKKMEIVVDEMSAKLDKPVKLLVKGEDTVVDMEMREKISGALIHVIRNAVDHGIEDMETRDRYGKAPMGLIKLKFSTEDGRLKVTVKDDGAGIDTKQVLEKAERLHLLTKPAEEYTEKEILYLTLVNGMTTTQTANDYSGRGVGMDVINHNVRELGGKLKISSEAGCGTTITMKF